MSFSITGKSPQLWSEGEALTFSLDRDAMLAGLAIRVHGTIHGAGGGAPALRTTMPGPLLADIEVRADGAVPYKANGILAVQDNAADGLEPALELSTPAAGANAALDVVFYVPFTLKTDRAVRAGREFWLDTRRYNSVELALICGTLADLGADIDSASLEVEVAQVRDTVLLPPDEYRGKLLRRRRIYRSYTAFTADVVDEGPKSGALRRLVIVSTDTAGDLSSSILDSVQIEYYGGITPVNLDGDLASAVTRLLSEGNTGDGVFVVDFDELGLGGKALAEMFDLRKAGMCLRLNHNADGRVYILYETILPDEP